MSQQSGDEKADAEQDRCRISLNPVRDHSAIAELLRYRRSTKSYRPDHINLQTLSGLLSTVLGSVSGRHRTYGSAHARYDIVVTVVVAAVEGLPTGTYRYLAVEHALVHGEEGDHRTGLADGTLDAAWLSECPVILMLSADLDAANRAFESQGTGRGERFCWFEAGLVAQNIYLWAAEKGLGTVFLGGLDHFRIEAATQRLIPPSHTVLGMLPIGRPTEAPARP
ncbi:SagB/ThcOx family dehydrogenase [Nesterenkonia muleiensis]|uniref:SagB/ThcOx family dehydrogenase n=1 Tax=Nesterenkonia muleiensis TaxID=2282648 RepID=UPI000E767E41|nr:SagB/ThcOx family dehydrogenase [Nesterenkonia muleiensis]